MDCSHKSASRVPGGNLLEGRSGLLQTGSLVLYFFIIRALQAPAWEVQRTAGAVGAIGRDIGWSGEEKWSFLSWDPELICFFEPGSLSSENLLSIDF